jgi:beta-aspartyl-peptidase (threonine type)
VGQGATPQEAAEQAIDYLHRRLHGHGGLILLDRQGRIGLHHNTPRMAWAIRREDSTDAGIERNR